MQTTSAVELDGSGLPLESSGFLASTSTAEILPWPIVPQPPTETTMGHHTLASPMRLSRYHPRDAGSWWLAWLATIMGPK